MLVILTVKNCAYLSKEKLNIDRKYFMNYIFDTMINNREAAVLLISNKRGKDRFGQGGGLDKVLAQCSRGTFYATVSGKSGKCKNLFATSAFYSLCDISTYFVRTCFLCFFMLRVSC